MDQSGRTAIEGLRCRLESAAREPDRARRLIRVVAVLTRALGTVGVQPVLVGGGAVEFYTAADYQTEDIDLLAPSTPDVIETMCLLGFERRGKDFCHRGLDLYVEFPGSAMNPPERTIVVAVDGEQVRVVSPEDLLLDRLRAFVYWRSLRDAVNILSLLRSGTAIESDRVLSLAREESLAGYWEGLKSISDDPDAPASSESLEARLRKVLDGRDR